MAAPLLRDAERLSKVIARMDAGDDGSIPAFNLLTRALAGSGKTWTDVLGPLVSGATPSPPTSEGRRPSRKAANNGTDLGAWLRATEPPKRPAPQRQQILQGRDVPGAASGIITVVDERTTRRGSAMLIVLIENAAQLCGPIAVFDDGLVAAIKAGDCLSGTAHVQPPAADHLYPVLKSFADVRQAA